MATDWSIFFAVLLFLVLIIFLYRQWRHSARSRERKFNITLDAPLVIGAAKWEALTLRQQQVARLAARGMSNAEIAHQLGVKPNTVIAHLKKIYATLDVHSRTELGYKIRDYLD